MPSNPFRRKRDPLQQVFDVLDAVRADAANTAADIRDTAAKAADALGEAAPDETKKRLPLIGVAVAGTAAVVIALKARAGKSAPAQQPPPPPVQSAAPNAAATAASATTAPPAAPSPSGPGEEKQEPEVAGTTETISEPKAQTDESRAAGS